MESIIRYTDIDMTPKEKAKELWDKYLWIAYSTDLYHAKKCIIIAIENEYYSNRELLMHLKGCGALQGETLYLALFQKLIDEEKEVKQEIENL